MWEDSDGIETVALWPHPVYAKACYEGDPNALESDAPIFYRLDHFLNVSLPILRYDKTNIGIFPVGTVFADVLSARDFGVLMDAALGGVIDIS